MKHDTIRKLPPMSALEFAIGQSFRNFLFSVMLALMWALVQMPLLVAAYFLALKDGIPDPKELPPAAAAVLIALAVINLLAIYSIAVNWHRRLILRETPRRLGWIRLDGVVWKYLFCSLVIYIILGLIAAAAAATVLLLVPRLEPRIGAAAVPVGYAIAGLLGLFGLFAWYRLSTWLPAVAVGDRDYGLAHAWRTTRKNGGRFLGFTFWLLFTFAMGGAMAAGGYFAQLQLGQPWAGPAAIAVIALISWLSLLVVASIASSHYYYFGAGKDFPVG